IDQRGAGGRNANPPAAARTRSAKGGGPLGTNLLLNARRKPRSQRAVTLEATVVESVGSSGDSGMMSGGESAEAPMILTSLVRLLLSLATTLLAVASSSSS